MSHCTRDQNPETLVRMSPPTDLVALFEEHRSCGDLEGEVRAERVVVLCDCGAVRARPVIDTSALLMVMR